jgi:hypothetical protein
VKNWVLLDVDDDDEMKFKKGFKRIGRACGLAERKKEKDRKLNETGEQEEEK